MYYVRAFHHACREKVRNYVAETHGVTVEHLLDIIKKRKAYRLARYWRKRQRMKAQAINPLYKAYGEHDVTEMRAGEGELHGYLRVVGLTLREFAAICGMSYSSVKDWYGHALYNWPVEFLRMYGWTQNMAKKLQDMGINPEQFKPPIPTRRWKEGRYPRKNGDVKVADGNYSPFTAKRKLP